MVDTRVTLATGTAERETALPVPAPTGSGWVPTGPTTSPALSLICGNATPRVAQRHPSTIGDRWADDPSTGYAVSGRVRKRIEKVFAWIKVTAGFRKTHQRGLARIRWMLTLMATVYNLVRLPKLMAAVA